MKSLTLLLLLIATPLAAQTTTAKAQWTMTEAQPIAQSYVYTLKVGSVIVPLGTVTCVAGTVTTCTAPLTPPLTSGSYTITATNGFGSTTSDPFVGAGPSKPSFTITITITIP